LLHFFPLPSLPSVRNQSFDAHVVFLLFSIQAPGSRFLLFAGSYLLVVCSLLAISAIWGQRLGCDMLGECGRSALVGGGGLCEVLGRTGSCVWCCGLGFGVGCRWMDASYFGLAFNRYYYIEAMSNKS
jgi:hypothetical protein